MENEKTKKLLELLREMPPNLKKIESYVVSEKLTSEEISIAMIEFSDECQWEDSDFFQQEIDDNITEERLKECHSYYLYELIELLLKYGLDPNYEYDEATLTESIIWNGLKYIAADAMILLLKNGADIDKVLYGLGGSSIFNRVFFDVGADAHVGNQPNRRRYEALVHLWFVMLAHENDLTGIQVLNGFDIKKLENHRNYDFCLVRVPNGFGDSWSLRIFDKYTRWEVVIF